MPEFHSMEEYLQFAREKEQKAKERGHLTDEEFRHLGAMLGSKQISRESYFDVLDEFITPAQAEAIGYEESPEYQVKYYMNVYDASTKKEKRIIARAKSGKPPRECLCGCGGMTRGGKFIMGHDMKLKGKLNRGEVHEGNITQEQRRFADKHGKNVKIAPTETATV